MYILFDISGKDTWIAGVYYMKNIIYQLTIIENSENNIIPIIVYSSKYSDLFDPFKNKAELIKYKNGSKLQRLKSLIYAIGKCDKIYCYHQYKFDPMNLLSRKAIYWIPDFQEHYYPGYFSEQELQKRKDRAISIVNSPAPLVLSSKSCYNDFIKLFPNKENGKVYIVPFVSDIVKELSDIDEIACENILKKYNLNTKKIVLVSNQFWQHKNHIVVLKAIKEISLSHPDCELQFVFTGGLKDYRNPNYFKKLTDFMEDEDVKQRLTMLGFIDRVEQLVLMKKAKFIIQPSLFEGWGTVVEDAKVLNKLILLSNIPIHHEQMNENCLLFNPNDSQSLVSKIIEVSKKEHVDDMEIGINDMHKRAKEYAAGLLQMVGDLQKA